MFFMLVTNTDNGGVVSHLLFERLSEDLSIKSHRFQQPPAPLQQKFQPGMPVPWQYEQPKVSCEIFDSNMKLNLYKWAISAKVLASLCLMSCAEEPEIIKPVLTISDHGQSYGNHTYYSIWVDINKMGTREIISHGFICSEDQTPDINTDIVLEYDELYGDYFYGYLNCPPLLPNKTYKIWAFVKTKNEEIHLSDNSITHRTPTGTWTKLGDFPGPHRMLSLTFTANGKAYLLGGKSLEGNEFSDLWCYNPDTDEWVQKASYPENIHSEEAGVFVIDNVPYIVEANGSSYADLYNYDVQNDQWVKIGNGLSKQSHILAFSINGKGYAGGGFFEGYFFEYNPQTNTWTQKRSYPGEAMYNYYSGAVQYSQLGYAGFGKHWTNGSYENEFYEYNPVTNEWTKRYSFWRYDSHYLKGMVCFTTSNKIYFGMGRNSNDADLATLFEYTRNSGWVEVNSLPGTERSNAVAFAIHNTGYVGLGLKHHYEGQVDKLMDFWKFTP
jgi:N-acetylneuraminic acid mutarotase